MTPEAPLDTARWHRVEQILDAALSTDPVHWPPLLDNLCAGDPDLRHEVDALLRHSVAAHAFLDSLPIALAAAVVAERREVEGNVEWAGRLIGAFRIVREIGRGGMARVFLAERSAGDFDQRVALKLLRPGLDTEIDQHRFRAEQQILATLNHPNIARLLDGGVTADGQHYLALEYVDGRPIDAYCEANSLTTRQRLEIFLTVIDAVKYAHRNLVVHRDLKPSNILIDDDGRVKLLDFGLAKLLQPDPTLDMLPITRTQQRWLTPEYAAPEQILGESISTLTDVYQLGAVLYRLVTGAPPFARDASFHELEAAVLAREPELPSIAASRTRPDAARPLRGDIDAVVLKALRKEPEDRYATVESLGEDVRRHLDGRPVLARRQTVRYRARRFVRRRWRETIGATVIVLSLVVGAVAATVEAHRAAVQRDRAEAASRDAAGVTGFVLGLFEASAPEETRGDTLTAWDLVRRGAARAEQLRANPAEEASMLEVTSRLSTSLGRFSEAYGLLVRALALRRGTRHPDDLKVAGTLMQLSRALLTLGRNAEADSVAREALALQQRTLGSTDPALAPTYHKLADLAIARGNLFRAESLHRRGLELRVHGLGPDDSLTGVSHMYLGSILGRRGQVDSAEREFRRALSILERAHGLYHPLTADAVMQLAYLLSDEPARRAEAGVLMQRGLEIRRRVFGDEHPMTAYTLSDLADYQAHNGQTAEAVATARRYLTMLQHAYGNEHPVVATALGQVGNILVLDGRFAEAESLYRAGLAMERRVRGTDHVNIAGHEVNLARLFIDRGRYAEAEPLLRDAIRIQTRLMGSESPNVEYERGLLGRLLGRTGNYSAADSLLRGAIASAERQMSPEHPIVRELHAWLAEVDSAQHAASGKQQRVGQSTP